MKENKPFFSVITFTQPHLPTLPHPDFIGKTGKGNYSDVLAEIDFRAGQVIGAIEKAGIKDNTLVIWFSDNGPEWHMPYQALAGHGVVRTLRLLKGLSEHHLLPLGLTTSNRVE